MPHAGRTTNPLKGFGYAIASVVIGGSCVIWNVLGVPFDPQKHNAIGMVASVIGLLLGFAAYSGPNRKRSLAVVGLSLCLAAFVATWLLPEW